MQIYEFTKAADADAILVLRVSKSLPEVIAAEQRRYVNGSSQLGLIAYRTYEQFVHQARTVLAKLMRTLNTMKSYAREGTNISSFHLKTGQHHSQTKLNLTGLVFFHVFFILKISEVFSELTSSDILVFSEYH